MSEMDGITGPIKLPEIPFEPYCTHARFVSCHHKCEVCLESKLAERDAEIEKLKKDGRESCSKHGPIAWWCSGCSNEENLKLIAERDSLQKKLLDYEGQTNCCMECERWAKNAKRYRAALDSAKGFIIRRQCIGPDAEAIVSEISKALRQGEGEP